MMTLWDSGFRISLGIRATGPNSSPESPQMCGVSDYLENEAKYRNQNPLLTSLTSLSAMGNASEFEAMRPCLNAVASI